MKRFKRFCCVLLSVSLLSFVLLPISSTAVAEEPTVGASYFDSIYDWTTYKTTLLTRSNLGDYQTITAGGNVYFNDFLELPESNTQVAATAVSVSDLSVQPGEVISITLSNFSYLLYAYSTSDGWERNVIPDVSSLLSHYAVFYDDGTSDIVYNANCVTPGNLYNFVLTYENKTEAVITEVVFNSFWDMTGWSWSLGLYNLFNLEVSCINAGIIIDVTQSETGLLQSILNYIQDIKDKISSIPTYLTDIKNKIMELPTYLTAIKEKIQELPTYLTAIKEKIQELPTYLTAIKEKIQELPTYLIEIKDKILGLPDLIAEKIKALFIPSDEAIERMKLTFDNLLKDRFGAVYQVVDYLGEYIGLIFEIDESEIQEYIELPLLEVELSDEPFEFGGWQVDVIPDGFEGIAGVLKWIISAVCSLMFMNMLRRKFDYLLEGRGSDAG